MAVADQPFSQLDASGRLHSRSRLPAWLKTLLHNSASVGGFFLAFFFAPMLAPSETPLAPFRISRSRFQAVPHPLDAPHPFRTTQGQYDLYYSDVGGTIITFEMGIRVTLYAQRTPIILSERGRSMAIIHLDDYHPARARV